MNCRCSPNIKLRRGNKRLSKLETGVGYRKEAYDARPFLVNEYSIPYYSPKRYFGSLREMFQLLPVMLLSASKCNGHAYE
jgi:hypothetical protein